MTKYEIILYWSAEDDAFIAEVPELPGRAILALASQAPRHSPTPPPDATLMAVW